MSHSISPTRRLVVVAAVGGLALALSACGSSPSGGGSGNVAAVVKGLDNPFFQTMESGIKEEASTAGTEVTVQAANSITDTTGQADKLNGLAGQDFTCFIVNPITGTNLIQGIAQLVGQERSHRQHRQPHRRRRRQGRQRQDHDLHRHRQRRRGRPGRRRDGQTAARWWDGGADRRNLRRRDQRRPARRLHQGGARATSRSSRPWPPTGNARWRSPRRPTS